jgi:hypothetical protein
MARLGIEDCVGKWILVSRGPQGRAVAQLQSVDVAERIIEYVLEGQKHRAYYHCQGKAYAFDTKEEALRQLPVLLRRVSEVVCPRCGAIPRNPCRTPKGRRHYPWHREREEAAAKEPIWLSK